MPQGASPSDEPALDGAASHGAADCMPGVWPPTGRMMTPGASSAGPVSAPPLSPTRHCHRSRPPSTPLGLPARLNRGHGLSVVILAQV
jgi:hypothetical protein